LTENDGVEFIEIPGKGKVQAQLFENRVRVYCFFDPEEETWIKLPLKWELHSAAVKAIVQLVQDVCPDWRDEADILALLRACNYNVDECVNAYHCTTGRNAQSSSASRERKKKRDSPRPGSVKKEEIDETGRLKEMSEKVEAMMERISELERELAAEKTAHERVMITEVLGRYQRSGNSNLARLNEIKALYRQEVEQRRQLYNTLIELRGNIRVFCRVRPSFEPGASFDMFEALDENSLAAKLPNSTQRNYQFDRVFQPSARQEEIFGELRDIITSVADGYNVCIMAYGQTGSGKTFTMQGPSNNPGVNIRMVEIYNETIVDLISPSNGCEVLDLRNLGVTVTVVGATWEPVETEEQIQQVLARGEKNRHVASTKINSTSSRSHLVVSVNVVGRDSVSGTVNRGSLLLCDLAGSERAEVDSMKNTERFAETTHINMSLSALGQVFAALRNNQLHVPYRNSKLTQILQPCLGGDSKACLIVNVSSEPKSLHETLSTLLFGANARQITLGPAKAHVYQGRETTN
uniref:Kinesin-like protein n=1 Tax=Schistocephalus solidus TaxID=70667 RepID=A0A183SJ23_SCHSO